LDNHITVAASDICELKKGKEPDGLTAEMERSLRSRKKVHPNQTEEDRWKEIYRLLFPNQEIPSPCKSRLLFAENITYRLDFEHVQEEHSSSPDSQDLANYEQYLRDELPPLVRSNIENVFRREQRPVEASLIASLVDTIQDCQDRLFGLYWERLEASRNLEASEDLDLDADDNITTRSNPEATSQRAQQEQRSSDLLVASFQPAPLMANIGLLPTTDDLLNHHGQSRNLDFSSASNSTVPIDSGYGSDFFCNCPGPCTHTEVIQSQTRPLPRGAYHETGVDLDMNGNPFRLPDCDLNSYLGNSDTYSTYG
jgi:hypothetical protein